MRERAQMRGTVDTSGTDHARSHYQEGDQAVDMLCGGDGDGDGDGVSQDQADQVLNDGARSRTDRPAGD